MQLSETQRREIIALYSDNLERTASGLEDSFDSADDFCLGRDAEGRLVLTTTETQAGRINLAVAQAAIREGRRPQPNGERLSVYLAPDHRRDALGDVTSLARERLGHELGPGSVPRFELTRTWRYLPIFSKRALQGGAPARVWCDQGRRRIWNIGAAASMDSVPNIVDYNLRLLGATGLA